MNARLRGGLTLAAVVLMLAGPSSPAADAVTPDTTAAAAQYAANAPSTGTGRSEPSAQVPLGEEVVPPVDGSDNLPEGIEEAPVGQAQSSPSSETRLPFTGYLALPILIAGVLAITGGLLLRRRTREPSPA
jgi:hypothetical protein